MNIEIQLLVWFLGTMSWEERKNNEGSGVWNVQYGP